MIATHHQNTVIIDTNFYVSSILKDETRYFETVRKIGVYEKQNFLICLPQPMVFEIISVMRREKFSRHLIHNFYYNLYSDPNYKILSINFEELCLLGMNFPNRTNLKATDYQFLLYCAKFKPDFIETYDKQILKNLHEKDQIE